MDGHFGAPFDFALDPSQLSTSLNSSDKSDSLFDDSDDVSFGEFSKEISK